MPLPSIPDPDIPPPLPATPGVVRAQPDDHSFETDFSALAARFASRSGGGLSPELAADLALEIVLHEIVEQACVATGATGAAIVLLRDRELVCRARSGKTAPELGSRLAADSGLSAECIRTRQVQRCEDAEADSRADVEASRRLGVSSVLVLPLLRGDTLVGVFELFSARTYAFGEREERALQALADRALQSLQQAAEPLPPSVESESVLPEYLEEAAKNEEAGNEDSPMRSSNVTWIWAAAVILSAAMLAVAIVAPLARPKLMSRDAAPPPGSSISEPSAAQPQASAAEDSSLPSSYDKFSSSQTAPRPGAEADSIPAGSLSVYADGKEIFHLPPARSQVEADEAEQGTAVPRAAKPETEKLVELSPAPDSAMVLKSVEPAYPVQALRQRIQGPVVLDVRISSKGEVQQVRTISGAAVLANASVAAMKQWRFQPRLENGRAVDMQTRVTLTFRLPE
jgi:TonB family protein